MATNKYGYTLRSDGRYQGYWRELDERGEPTGKRHAICDKDPKVLRKKIQEKEKPAKKTLKDVADEWEPGYRQTIEPTTWKNYGRIYADLLARYGKMPIEDITSADVTQWVLHARDQHFSKTVVRESKVLFNHILSYAALKGYIRFNPALGVKMPKGMKERVRRAPTDEEIAKVIAAKDTQFGFFAFFLLCTGLRKGEALALERSDIDLKNRTINVYKSVQYIGASKPTLKPPKSESGNRIVPIIEPLVEPLEKYLKLRKETILFPNYNFRYNEYHNQLMMKRAYDAMWERYCADAGLLDADGKSIIGAHNLRHGTATLLYNADVDIKTTQLILGHSDPGITMRVYTELRDQRSKQSTQAFENVIADVIAKSMK